MNHDKKSTTRLISVGEREFDLREKRNASSNCRGNTAEMQWYGMNPKDAGHKQKEMRRDGWRVRLLDLY